MIRSAICIAFVWAVIFVVFGADITRANAENNQGDKARITVGAIESKDDNCSSSVASGL